MAQKLRLRRKAAPLPARPSVVKKFKMTNPAPTSVKEARLFIEIDGLLPAEKYGTLAQLAKMRPRDFFVDDRCKVNRRELGKLINELCALRGTSSMYRWPK